MKADDFLKFISRKHAGEEWAVFHEFRCGTGFGKGNESRLDSLVLGLWRSNALIRIAYEIKVSRSDFLREVKAPLKQVPALRISNRFYYVTPPGLLKVEEIPPWAGLLEVRESDLDDAPNWAKERAARERWLKNYPYMDKTIVTAPDRIIEFEQASFIAALARRVSRREREEAA